MSALYSEERSKEEQRRQRPRSNRFKSLNSICIIAPLITTGEISSQYFPPPLDQQRLPELPKFAESSPQRGSKHQPAAVQARHARPHIFARNKFASLNGRYDPKLISVSVELLDGSRIERPTPQRATRGALPR